MRRALVAFLWLALIVGLGLLFRDHTPLELAGLLRNPAGPLLYIGLYALRPLAFFSAAVLSVLAGSVWGPWLGSLYVVVGSNLSSLVAYGLARGVALPDGLRDRWSGPLRTRPFQTILFMRLIFLPYDLVNYLAGWLRVPLKTFLAASALGALPGTLTFSLAGASLRLEDVLAGRFSISALNPWTLLASALLLAASLALSARLKQQEVPHA